MKIVRVVYLTLALSIGPILGFGQKPVNGVVKITTYKQGVENSKGAGFIVGNLGKEFYIVTAFHNLMVNRMTGELVDDIQIEFYDAQGNPARFKAELPRRISSEYDLALLTTRVQFFGTVLPYKFKAHNASKIRAKEEVSIIGHPLDRDFFYNSLNQTIVSEQPHKIDFTNQYVHQGFSGGPLLTGKSERLMGMVTQTAGGNASALKIDEILFFLESWRIPINLIKDPIERRTYLNGSVFLASLSAGFYFHQQSLDKYELYERFESDDAAFKVTGKDRQALFDDAKAQRTYKNIAFGTSALSVLLETSFQLGLIGKKKKHRKELLIGNDRSSLQITPNFYGGVQMNYRKKF